MYRSKTYKLLILRSRQSRQLDEIAKDHTERIIYPRELKFFSHNILTSIDLDFGNRTDFIFVVLIKIYSSRVLTYSENRCWFWSANAKYHWRWQKIERKWYTHAHLHQRNMHFVFKSNWMSQKESYHFLFTTFTFECTAPLRLLKMSGVCKDDVGWKRDEKKKCCFYTKNH